MAADCEAAPGAVVAGVGPPKPVENGGPRGADVEGTAGGILWEVWRGGGSPGNIMPGGICPGNIGGKGGVDTKGECGRLKRRLRHGS